MRMHKLNSSGPRICQGSGPRRARSTSLYLRGVGGRFQRSPGADPTRSWGELL